MTKYPIFSSPEESIRALAALRDFHCRAAEIRTQKPELRKIDGQKVRAILGSARAAGRTELGFEALGILEACGIPVAPFRLCASAGEAAAAAADLGFPVALKIVSPDILHKTEAAGVSLNLKDSAECESAFARMTAAAKEKFPGCRIDGVCVQKMAPAGREVIVGAKENESFGHVVVFGPGGILVEALGDVSMRVAPLGLMDADEMLGEIKSAKILGAFRGMPPADLDALRDVLFRVSTLVAEFPEIRELDINPVIALPEGEGCMAVDARIVL